MATGGVDGRGDDPALIDNSTFVSNVTCAICLETYRRPKLLPCFHTFCQSCLQTVAGTAPSFPCPACRANVLLPDGGVAALQNNFYVEQELGTNATAAAARLCDACDDDREAAYSCFQCRQRFCSTCRRCHDSISSCRSHTVVPLQPATAENLKGNDGGAGDNDEEKCLKHKNQPVILHCVACKVSICIQCKLTSHEGHPTEDLADTGNKAKASLQDALKTLKEQVRKLEGVMEAVKQKASELHVLLEDTEREIRQRADILHKWTDDCRDNALHTLQSLNGEAVATLAETRTHVQHKQSALTARSEHVTRVLHDDKITDIVTLNDQLKGDAPADVDNVNQMLDSIDSISKPYQVDHNAAVVNIAQLQEYLGILGKTSPRKKQAQYTTSVNMPGQSSISSQTQAATLPTPTICRNPKPMGSVTCHKMFYSKNPKSVVSPICVTSEKRVWIMYRPSGEGLVMGLLNFNQKGLLQKFDVENEEELNMITCYGDSTLVFSYCNEGSLVKVPDCTHVSFSGSWEKQTIYGVSKCVFGNEFYAVNSSDLVYIKVTCVGPVTMHGPVVVSPIDGYKLFDVSHRQEYVVTSGRRSATDMPVKVFVMPQERNSLHMISSYTPAKVGIFKDREPKVLDACFFTLNGQEMLLITFEHEHRIHVVDHTDGCLFVRYLDTSPHSVENPCRLATDHTKVLWIACTGGKVVMLNFQ